jgi:hypothetical protein
MWEDESTLASQLQVTEVGLITKVKEQAFHCAYFKQHSSLINHEIGCSELSSAIINLL